jgi:hypothetical protein
MRKLFVIAAACLMALQAQAEGWVRINQLGYLPGATKVAVYMGSQEPEDFEIIDVYTGQTVFRAAAKATGPLGQIAATWQPLWRQRTRLPKSSTSWFATR